MKKPFLFGLTALLIIVGLVVLAFEFKYKVGEAINVGGTNNTNNSNGTSNSDSIVTAVDFSFFGDSNLKFTAKFLSYSVPQSLATNKTQSEVQSVSFSDEIIKISVDQKQFCDSKQKLMEQVGLYNLNNTNLILTNLVTQSDDFQTPCLVKLTYEISKISSDFLLSNKSFVISFQNESKLIDSTHVCIYDSKIYNNGDYFSASDKCNTCSCNKGISSCSTGRVCEKKEE